MFPNYPRETEYGRKRNDPQTTLQTSVILSTYGFLGAFVYVGCTCRCLSYEELKLGLFSLNKCFLLGAAVVLCWSCGSVETQGNVGSCPPRRTGVGVLVRGVAVKPGSATWLAALLGGTGDRRCVCTGSVWVT